MDGDDHRLYIEDVNVAWRAYPVDPLHKFLTEQDSDKLKTTATETEI